jgi:heme/copper-type cytochrome/quinol oxidase subunit 3
MSAAHKLLMKLFVASEAFFFLCLMVAYVYFWQAAHFRRDALRHLALAPAAVYTALLLASSLSFFLSERSHARQRFQSALRWLGVTLLLGLAFMAGQSWEYFKLISRGLAPSSGEFGTGFYTLTGFHGLHVLLGLIVLSVLFALSWRGHLRSHHAVIAAAGIYWHFVDAVWLAVFTLVYLLPHFMQL